MAKDTYYFRHDYNARNDFKMQALIDEYGGVAYAVYFVIIEMLHEETGNELPLGNATYRAVSRQLSTSVEQAESIVNGCLSVNLFVEKDEYFHSPRVDENIQKRHDISSKRSAAGKKSAQIRQKMPQIGQKSTSVKQKIHIDEQNPTKKRKEKKRKDIYIGDGIINFEIAGLGDMHIVFNPNCKKWQSEELEKFLTKSQGNFETMAMKNKVLNNRGNFNTALQAFMDMIQSTDEYQEAPLLRKYFSNWISKKNGTLSDFLVSSKMATTGKMNKNSIL